ncbi:uncharacterized protein [Macrobrachium rosenbergii]|uniref:uncharacterized protein n=1 Tax=Macrobrachium rosenbergii TaxID=79674 RepID=UPI0034D67D8A
MCDDAKPVVMPDRRVPISVRPKLKEELDRLVNLGVIVRVEQPTPWVSQLVIAHKRNSDIRVCLDPKELNKVLLHEHYTLPVSKADLASGYWCREQNVKLNKEKLVLRTDNVSFVGHVITKDGLRSDPEKLKAISEFPTPQTLEELRRLLGSTLMQEGKPIAFASRALANAERNYAQIEKEMLAILYGLNKFHHFTFGRFVTVITDHQPLVSIVKKPLTCAPKRLQARLLRVQEYNFEVVYKSGKDIPIADALSRAPTCSLKCEEVVSVNNLSFSSFKPYRLDEIRAKTQSDNTLKTLKQTIIEGWPQKTTSDAVITKLKHHFARHGIPDVLISDYSSHLFDDFARKWGFSHEPISPRNSKTNGAVEAAVRIAKNLMKKCKKAKEDPYLGLLNLRYTFHEGLETSPVQRLMGRHAKTLIPTVSNRLKPSNFSTEKERRKLIDKRFAVADRYSNRKQLKPLCIGDTVRVQPIDNKTEEWKQATVSKKLSGHTYVVCTDDGGKYRKNRQFLRKSVKS